MVEMKRFALLFENGARVDVDTELDLVAIVQAGEWPEGATTRMWFDLAKVEAVFLEYPTDEDGSKPLFQWR